MTEECIHLLDPATCSICLPPKPKKLDDFVDTATTARYGGTCWCGGAIYEGDPIGRDEDGQWAHEECA